MNLAINITKHSFHGWYDMLMEIKHIELEIKQHKSKMKAYHGAILSKSGDASNSA